MSTVPPCSRCLDARGWVHVAHLAEEDPGTLALMLAREDTSAMDRALIARELGRAGPALAGPILHHLLTDPSPMVRADALEALGRLGGTVAIEMVRGLANADPSMEVREQARTTLLMLLPPETCTK